MIMYCDILPLRINHSSSLIKKKKMKKKNNCTKLNVQNKTNIYYNNTVTILLQIILIVMRI